MKLKDIKVGNWYKTKAGIGRVVSATKFRGMLEVQIVYPMPMGQRVVKPAEVFNEVDPKPEKMEKPEDIPLNWRDDG